MSPIKLDLVNQSNDNNNSQIIIFEAAANGPGNDGAGAPLLVHRVVALPPAGQSVSVVHQGDSITLAVAPSATPGTLVDPAGSVGPPVRLALPHAPFATIVVRGGGTGPVSFALADGAGAAGADAGNPGTGLLGGLIRSLRRVWRSITGG